MRRDFTPAHVTAPAAGGRVVFSVDRRTAVGALVAAGALALWAAAATWFVAARDDLAQRVFIGETEMRYSYEDRLGRLRQELEREVTQNMVERRSFEGRAAALAARQAEIEQRQAWLRAAADRAGTPAGPLSVADRLPALPRTLPGAPAPDGNARRSPASEERTPSRDRLSALEDAAARVLAEDADIVRTFGAAARSRVSRLRSVLASTGIDLPRSASEPPMGGPLVPLPRDAAGGFDVLLAEIDLNLSEAARLKVAAKAVPIGLPLAGELDPTSPFGYRMDPFTRGPALHTGVDFRSETGAPARVTAGGRVTMAEYTGGYGNLVEVDHGNGVATRYGHLSSLAVMPGERVEAGAIIGRTGSTGRSTGPHLHYEVRINGEPVNPVRFIEAGRLFERGSG